MSDIQRRMEFQSNDIEDPASWGLQNVRQNQQMMINSQILKFDQGIESHDKLIKSYLDKIINHKKQHTNDVKDQKFFKKRLILKNLIKQQKKKALVQNFLIKNSRNLVNRLPVTFEPYQKKQIGFFSSLNGINLPTWVQFIFSCIYICQTLTLLFFLTTSLVFAGTNFQGVVNIIEGMSICVYCVQILLKMFETQTMKGKRITKIKYIAEQYLRKQFWIDFGIILVLSIDISSDSVILSYLRMIMILKLRQCLKRLENMQNYFINNFYKEQYWGLTKVFITNFLFAHFLAIILLAMASLSQTNSWLHKLQIHNDPWYQQYAWSYYWGTTTMLTIGFGDISPANYKEAVCLTIIETISCILLAYNINCVGNLIHNIRSQDSEKNESLKTMRRLAKENSISEDLEWKVCNFINESDKMRKKFKFDGDKKFISSLPTQLKGEYLKEANRSMFKQLTFFKSLTEKTLMNLAEHIQVKIAHPEEIIFKAEEKQQILILKNGLVGYCTRNNGSSFNQIVIDKVSVKKHQSNRLLHLHFLNPQMGTNYLIKSLDYSVICLVDMEKAADIIKKSSSFDFQNYCEIKDRSKHIIDEFQILVCDHCKTKHSKMKCPKLHFCPIKQLVIYKELAKVKSGINIRKFKQRSRPSNWQTLKPLVYYSSDLQNMEITLYGRKMKKNSSKKKRRRAGGIFFDEEYDSIKQELSQKLNSSSAMRRQQTCKSEGVFQIKQFLDRKFSYLYHHSPLTKQNHDEKSLQTDQLHDFLYYCTSYNPKNLDIHFSSKENNPALFLSIRPQFF